MPPLFSAEKQQNSSKFEQTPEKNAEISHISQKKLWETEEKYFNRPFYPENSQVREESRENPQKIKENLEKTEKNAEKLNDFKAQLPHIREKSQKPALIPQETGRKSEFPRFFESRTYNLQENPLETMKNTGFYGEGLRVSKSPPRKVQFSVQTRKKADKTPVFVEEFKQTATFSKHIFEDKTIIEVLEKNAVIRSQKPGNFDENYADFSRFSGKNRDIIREKQGKIVIEKGEEPSDPYARIGHVLFKILNLLSYLALSQSSDSSNLIYEAIIIFSALDFWVVKNISARFLLGFWGVLFSFLRMLIGFRYWSENGVDLKEKWYFETFCDRSYKENKMNTRFFWVSQTIFSIIWFIYAVYELFCLEIAMVICLIFIVFKSFFAFFRLFA